MPNKLAIFAICLACGMLLFSGQAVAAEQMTITLGNSESFSNIIKIFLLLSALALVPAIVMSMTCFTRIVIVLSFLRQAVGAQQIPPNQVIVGLALFLSLFAMKPVLMEIEQQAYLPYERGEMTEREAVKSAVIPLRKFMLKHVGEPELALMVRSAKMKQPRNADDIPLTVLIPAFMLSELRTAFSIAVKLFIPFIVIDLAVAMILTSLGMMMMPPVMISLPIKLIVFVMADGWSLVIESLIKGVTG